LEIFVTGFISFFLLPDPLGIQLVEGSGLEVLEVAICHISIWGSI